MKKLSMLLFLCVLTLTAGPLFAQSLHEPGSLLIFPLFDSGDSRTTIITVTNINPDHSDSDCRNYARGEVLLHYVYIDSEDWTLSDTDELLSPNDTLSVFARDHNPNQQKGFLIIYAQDPVDYSLIDFDHLIGSAIIVNTAFDFKWSYLPISFSARGNGGESECGHYRVNGDWESDDLHFDGKHYDSFPNTLLLNEFFGEGSPPDHPDLSFSNKLYMMSTSSGVTPIDLLGWNNNEKRFSRTFSFVCWLETTLGDITGAVTQGNLSRDGNPDELRGVATGWLKFVPDQSYGPVGILGIFAQQADIRGATFATGFNLHFAKLVDGPGGLNGIYVSLPR